LRDVIVPPLDRSRLQAVWQRVEERRARRARRWAPRHLVLAGAIGLALGIVVMRLRAPGPEPLRLVGPGSFAALASDGASRLVELSDGSSLLLGLQTRLELAENSGHAVEWRLPRGRVELEVRPGGPRRWTIRTAQASVEVVGTHFVVEETAAGTTVSVSRGEVLVRGAGVVGRVRSLVAGESLVVPAEPSPPLSATLLPTAPAPVTPPPSPVVPSPSPAVPSPAVPSPSRPAGLTTKARPHEAAAPLDPPPAGARSSAPATAAPSTAGEASRRDAEALLQAADRARRAGRLDEAVSLLQQAAADIEDEQQAAIASFTLGRLYAGPLARPAAAARAFARALNLGLPQALVEDTLLRQAQAWDAAGERAAAREVAARYLSRFPDGRHRKRMSRWLDAAPTR
jgi:transmembrane sensor